MTRSTSNTISEGAVEDPKELAPVPERVIEIKGRIIGPMDVTIRPTNLGSNPSEHEKVLAAARAVVIACRKLGSSNDGWRHFGTDQFWHGGIGIRIEWLQLLLKKGWIELVDQGRDLYRVTDSFVEFWMRP